MKNCDHDWETLICDRCGGYQGQKCNHCGDWNDGGDYMASNAHWCTCPGLEADEDEDEDDWVYDPSEGVMVYNPVTQDEKPAQV